MLTTDMSQTIIFCSKNVSLEKCHDFEKALKIFKLFDDKCISDNIDEIKDFESNNSDFLFEFYNNNVCCIFDTFMMACESGNCELIIALLPNNLHKLNRRYCYGTFCEFTTPLSTICKNDKSENLVKHIKKLNAEMDLSMRDAFGQSMFGELCETW